jgi:LemA protein
MQHPGLSCAFAPSASSARNRSRGAALRGCLIAAAVVAVLLFALGGCTVKLRNDMVTRNEAVDAAWSQIDNQYKRRYDLVPQLVETVRGAANFERSTLDAVIEARAQIGRTAPAGQVPTDAASQQAYLQAQQGLSGALGRLFALSESYPDLKASQNFLALQSQLEGTENRIGVARTDYIDAVRAYNTSIKRFPASLLAGVFGFEPRAQLSIEAAEREAPRIDFDAPR